jgi:multidrug efflux pump
MLARFFVDRPIFAWVIAIVISLTGVVCLTVLPISQYPDVAPPVVRISATYIGASAETVENTVIQVLEQQLTGLDGLMYFDSSSTSAGAATINVTFTQGTNPDTAQVQVQNRIQAALPRLPVTVQQQGIVVAKAQSDFLMIVSVSDSTDRMPSTELGDYLVSNLQDPIARVPGVGGLQVFGGQHAMRIWLDPGRLAAYSLMPSDIVAALQTQNTQVSAGKLGAVPADTNQQLSATVTAQSELRTPEQFEQVIVKQDASGAVVHLADVARVELGSEAYDHLVNLDGHPGAGMAVQLAPGANALDTAERVHTLVNDLSRTMPAGLTLRYPKDSTTFIRISIWEVVKTLIEAIVLVVAVMFVFLQSWRATLIPAIAVPVVLMGTFGVLKVFGYSINTMTMLGLVLSIGLLVDDAIVVVENVERLMREQKLSAREATIASMNEITGALVGIATVLSAVFVPMAFFSGSTGVIYRQFSITLVSSMVLSVFVALTISPALCAQLLKPSQEGGERSLGHRFTAAFERLRAGYGTRVAGVIARPVSYVILYLVIIGALALLFVRLPTGFLPSEDQGQIMVQLTLPPGATIGRTLAVGTQVRQYFAARESKEVEHIFTVAGFNFSGAGQNAGLGFIPLRDWSQRPGKQNSADAIARRATMALSSIRDAQVFSLNPPAVQGLGQSEGWELQLQAVPGTSREQLSRMRDELLSAARADPQLRNVRLGSLEDTPQLHVDVDQSKALTLGLKMADVNTTLSAAWGGLYVNDFIDVARVKKVYIGGDAPFRSRPEDLDRWFVRGAGGTMTPFSSFATTRWTYGAETLTRFNGLASYDIQGGAAPGTSSGTAMARVAELAAKLQGSRLAWTGQSYQQQLGAGQTGRLYTASILVVFLCLAALYESWSIPLSILLVIPLGVIGALLATTLRGLENDIYFQVALLTTIGLSAKNAILIVEFAEEAYEKGTPLVAAALTGARLRLRPILMTSLAFVAGVLPLALSTGAGASSRMAVGTGIVGGTITATLLALFFVPMFFVLIRRLFGRMPQAQPVAPAGASPAPGATS